MSNDEAAELKIWLEEGIKYFEQFEAPEARRWLRRVRRIFDPCVLPVRFKTNDD